MMKGGYNKEKLTKGEAVKFLFLIIFLFSTVAVAGEVQVELLKVWDGDTVKVRLNGIEENVRLEGIDCFETSINDRTMLQTKTNCLSVDEVIKKGKQSRAVLRRLLYNETEVILNWEKRDYYDRILGTIYMLDGLNINEYMLENGGCFVYQSRKRNPFFIRGYWK